jgi:hypothetical protein
VNNLPVAQRLLGHWKPETTAMIYGMPRTSTAQRIYAALVEKDRLTVASKERMKKQRKS